MNTPAAQTGVGSPSWAIVSLTSTAPTTTAAGPMLRPRSTWLKSSSAFAALTSGRGARGRSAAHRLRKQLRAVGATSFSMIQSGQHTCARASSPRARRITCWWASARMTFRLVSRHVSAHLFGAMSDADLTAKINRAVQDVTTGVDAALNAGARRAGHLVYTVGLDPPSRRASPTRRGGSGGQCHRAHQ